MAQSHGRAERIGHFVRDLAQNLHTEIDVHWPRVLRRVAGYNLDIKNPHDTSVAHTDPDELLADYQRLMTDLQQTRDRLKDELFSAINRTI